MADIENKQIVEIKGWNLIELQKLKNIIDSFNNQFMTICLTILRCEGIDTNKEIYKINDDCTQLIKQGQDNADNKIV